MERALPLVASRPARRSLPEVLFSNPWAALVIPLLVPLVFLLA